MNNQWTVIKQKTEAETNITHKKERKKDLTAYLLLVQLYINKALLPFWTLPVLYQIL